MKRRRNEQTSTTGATPPRQMSRWQAFRATKTCARTRRGEPTGEIFYGTRRYW
jgi:hypothetical protein